MSKCAEFRMKDVPSKGTKVCQKIECMKGLGGGSLRASPGCRAARSPQATGDLTYHRTIQMFAEVGTIAAASLLFRFVRRHHVAKP